MESGGGGGIGGGVKGGGGGGTLDRSRRGRGEFTLLLSIAMAIAIAIMFTNVTAREQHDRKAKGRLLLGTIVPIRPADCAAAAGLEVAKGLPARYPFVLQRAIAMLVVGGDRGREMRVGEGSRELRSPAGRPAPGCVGRSRGALNA